jgi:hypothetical protein
LIFVDTVTDSIRSSSRLDNRIAVISPYDLLKKLFLF